MESPSLGKRLKTIRLEHKYSPEFAAIKYGVCLKTLFNYEEDKFMPRADTLKRIADFYKIDIKELL